MLVQERTEGIRMDPAAAVRVDDRMWDAIVESLPDQLSVRARNRQGKYRNFLEGVLWVVGEDAFWGELPPRFGHWRASRISIG